MGQIGTDWDSGFSRKAKTERQVLPQAGQVGKCRMMSGACSTAVILLLSYWLPTLICKLYHVVPFFLVLLLNSGSVMFNKWCSSKTCRTEYHLDLHSAQASHRPSGAWPAWEQQQLCSTWGWSQISYHIETWNLFESGELGKDISESTVSGRRIAVHHPSIIPLRMVTFEWTLCWVNSESSPWVLAQVVCSRSGGDSRQRSNRSNDRKGDAEETRHQS